jgi:hypothetical protein
MHPLSPVPEAKVDASAAKLTKVTLSGPERLREKRAAGSNWSLRRCVVSANFVNIRVGRWAATSHLPGRPACASSPVPAIGAIKGAMKAPNLLAVGAAAAAMIFAASGAEAQQRPIGGAMRNPLPANGSGMHDRHRFFLPFFWVEREGPVIIEREVVREVPVVVEPKPPAPPREPYKIGASYASLPGGCMKLIEDGASYYLCSGEWYRQVGGGSAVKYKAVARP